MPRIERFDAYEAAPESIRKIFKFYQKCPYDQLEGDHRVLDLKRGLRPEQYDFVHVAGIIPKHSLSVATGFLARQANSTGANSPPDVKVYEVDNLPGLRLIPSLVSPEAQEDLLSSLLHDNLMNEKHKTNVHLHYNFPSHATLSEECNGQAPLGNDNISIFRLSPRSTTHLFRPLDDIVHKPFTVAQFLCKKLRWLTLGGQFDWTGKRYPPEDEPPFPEDVGNFTSTIFPYMRPEAAIVNIYRPGDVLSVHRDVSEECDNALASFSLGCEAILVVGLNTTEEKEASVVAIRVRSGDAICLSGQARFAWHGVPRIFPGTCPGFLRDWPATGRPYTDNSQLYEAWRGWMVNNRVNLSVRQIRD